MSASQAWREHELARLAGGGWRVVPGASERIGGDPADRLVRWSSRWWSETVDTAHALVEWTAGKRFGEQVDIGLLFVPAPELWDMRLPVDEAMRRCQREDLGPDVFDARLDEGVNSVPDGAQGAVFVSCVGQYGVSLGSYDQIVGAPPADFVVAGVDARAPMTRQLWGARVLQAGHGSLPDTELNDSWTFTLFAGESLVGGAAQSGTVLKSRVRYRLGKSDRGIGSARSAPAVFVGSL